MKKCPYCAEEIQEDAIKCKHCGEFLIDAEFKRLQKQAGIEWYQRIPMLVFLIMLIGPFAIPLIKKNPQLTDNAKSILITVTIFITIIALVLLVLAVVYIPIIAFKLITGKSSTGF